MARTKRNQPTPAQEAAKAVRRAAREQAIRDGQYGRQTQVIPDRRKQASKRAARGRSFRNDY